MMIVFLGAILSTTTIFLISSQELSNTLYLAVVVGVVFVPPYLIYNSTRPTHTVATLNLGLIYFLNLMNYSTLVWLTSGFKISYLRLVILLFIILTLLRRMNDRIDVIVARNLDVFAFAAWTLLSGLTSPYSTTTGLLYSAWLGLSLLLILFYIDAFDDAGTLLYTTCAMFIWVNLLPTLTAIFNLQDALTRGARLQGSFNTDQLLGMTGVMLIVGLVVIRSLAKQINRQSLFTNPLANTTIILLTSVVLLFSGKRISILALCVFIATGVFVAFISGRTRRTTLVPIFMVTTIVSVLIVFLPDTVYTRYVNLFSFASRSAESQLSSSDTLRMTIYRANLEFALDNPLSGVGLANATLAASEHPALRAPWSSHSSYVGILSETGFVGMALFLVVAGRSFLQLLTRHTERRDDGSEASSEMGYVGTMVYLLPVTLVLVATETHHLPGQGNFFALWIVLLLPRYFLLKREVSPAYPEVDPNALKRVA